ncbi:hypothetical protein NSU_3009 [Novosphingobium pentaromativorans US6-1]|uniref:Uncharacterized protein n=1 Tax=Novosphingobium pentaromativorans US6-1 TaxID=1088721 RepID=G6EF87_9SPHN|nr:hypothetical protein NSU_3009 [Novosphingobium pentaromativorans US6-1]
MLAAIDMKEQCEPPPAQAIAALVHRDGRKPWPQGTLLIELSEC